MKAATVRSGLIESFHDWTAVLVSGDEIERTWGDGYDSHVFARSTAKPFQAAVSQELGAGLVPEHLAVACASHSATPAQIAIVDRMLSGVGLDESALHCPPSLPIGDTSRRQWLARGRCEERIAHNCSGKHAAFLRACRQQGWDTDSYLDPEHPLQQRMVDRVAELTTEDPGPVGVDGCGAPTMRLSLVGLARAFGRLTAAPELLEVRVAMTRYPALTSDNERADGRLAMWWPGPVKVGAQGLIGLGRNGWGLAVKSMEGSIEVAVMAAAEALRSSSVLEPHVIDALQSVARPAVLGGGEVVGEIVPDVDAFLATEERS